MCVALFCWWCNLELEWERKMLWCSGDAVWSCSWTQLGLIISFKPGLGQAALCWGFFLKHLPVDYVMLSFLLSFLLSFSRIVFWMTFLVPLQEKPEPGRANIYQSVVINSSKEMIAFSDFPPPAELPNNMHHSEVLLYMRLYAQAFQLLPHIRFQVSVSQAADRIRQCSICWKIVNYVCVFRPRWWVWDKLQTLLRRVSGTWRLRGGGVRRRLVFLTQSYFVPDTSPGRICRSKISQVPASEQQSLPLNESRNGFTFGFWGPT